MAVRVPVREASEAAVVWTRDDGPRPRWVLGSQTRAALVSSPAFEVRSWSVPDSVDYGERVDVSVTVANVGDRYGRFLATLGVRQGSVGVPETAVEVPAGETVSHAVTLDPHYYKGMEPLRVVLEWDSGRRETTVQARGSKTETGTTRPTA